MQAAVSVSYFHRKIGPMVYYSYPDDALKEEEKVRLADIMDQAFEEGFFTHRFGDLSSMNYYFEIQSEWARGNKEMLMLSVIIDSVPEPGVELVINGWAKSFANRLKNDKKIYKAFYSSDDSQVSESDHFEIKKFSENLRFWIKELYWMAIEELREKTEEEKWAVIMSQPQIFKVIKKLSKGPLADEDLRKWFNMVFPQYKLDQILRQLEEERFVFVNKIGMETYVLLVKDVNIMRVPPNCVIDLEEDSPELSDLTGVYINEVRDFFEGYTPTALDSLELFKLFADPKIYNVISQLREGPLPKEKILSMVSEKTTMSLLQTLVLLTKKGIIQELSYKTETLYFLKTDVVLTASFPEYLIRSLNKEAKRYVAQSMSHRKSIGTETTSEAKNLEQDLSVDPVEAGNEPPIKTEQIPNVQLDAFEDLVDDFSFDEDADDEKDDKKRKFLTDQFKSLL